MALLVVREDGFCRSQGLRSTYDQRELVIRYDKPQNRVAAIEMCEALMKYVEDSGRRILPGEKMGWATTVIQFQEDGAFLAVCSLDMESDAFDQGADDVLQRWLAQRAICEKNKSDYVVTNLIDNAVASPDVLEDGARVVEAVRYPFKSPNCGWWLFGESYTGEIMSMKVAHLGHVVLTNPAIAPYLALQPGFAFKPGSSVWFEEDVAAAEPV